MLVQNLMCVNEEQFGMKSKESHRELIKHTMKYILLVFVTIVHCLWNAFTSFTYVCVCVCVCVGESVHLQLCDMSLTLC